MSVMCCSSWLFLMLLSEVILYLAVGNYDLAVVVDYDMFVFVIGLCVVYILIEVYARLCST